MVKNETNIDLLIQEDYIQGGLEWDGNYNKTSLFLLPVIELNVKNDLMKKYFRNAYIEDLGTEHDLKCPLFLLFSVGDYKEKKWQDLEYALLNKPSLKDLYLFNYIVGKDGDNDLIMYVYKMPEHLEDDYYLFKFGKYSKLSKAFVAKHPKNIINAVGKTSESILWGIMNKSSNVKEKVARYFSVKDSKDKIIDMEAYMVLRKDMESWDEIWDKPNKKYECFRQEQAISGV